MQLADDQMCFVCGPKNPIGLKLEFSFIGDVYVTRFTPGPEHQGYVGVTHGGIVATVLDEVMARLVYAKGRNAVTAEITVRLKHPARTGEELLFSGWIEGERGRVIDCAAEARDSSGRVIAEAAARLLEVKP